MANWPPSKRIHAWISEKSVVSVLWVEGWKEGKGGRVCAKVLYSLVVLCSPLCLLFSFFHFFPIQGQMYESPESYSKGDPPLNLYCSDDPLSPYNCIQGYDEKANNKKKDSTTIGTMKLSRLDLGTFGIRLRLYDFESTGMYAFYSKKQKEEKEARRRKKLFQYDKKNGKRRGDKGNHRLNKKQQGCDLFCMIDYLFWFIVISIFGFAVWGFVLYGELKGPGFWVHQLEFALSGKREKKKFMFKKKVPRRVARPKVSGFDSLE